MVHDLWAAVGWPMVLADRLGGSWSGKESGWLLVFLYPVNRITHTSENFTFPRTTYVTGNNELRKLLPRFMLAFVK